MSVPFVPMSGGFNFHEAFGEGKRLGAATYKDARDFFENKRQFNSDLAFRGTQESNLQDYRGQTVDLGRREQALNEKRLNVDSAFKERDMTMAERENDYWFNPTTGARGRLDNSTVNYQNQMGGAAAVQARVAAEEAALRRAAWEAGGFQRSAEQLEAQDLLESLTRTRGVRQTLRGTGPPINTALELHSRLRGSSQEEYYRNARAYGETPEGAQRHADYMTELRARFRGATTTNQMRQRAASEFQAGRMTREDFTEAMARIELVDAMHAFDMPHGPLSPRPSGQGSSPFSFGNFDNPATYNPFASSGR